MPQVLFTRRFSSGLPLATFAWCLGVLLAACQSGKVATGGIDGTGAYEPQTVVMVGDELKAGLFRPSKIVIDYEDAVRTRDERLRVQVNLRNRSRSSIGIQAQTLFKDDDWTWVGEKVDWTLIRIKPGESKSYVAISDSPTPTRYTVRIRAFP